MDLPITNWWGHVTPQVVQVEHISVFHGRPGRYFSHQAQLTSDNGYLIATWSLGIADEEAPGQDMVMSVSDDGGDTWSEPTVIIASRREPPERTVVVSSGIRVVKDKWIAYCGEWVRPEEGMLPDGRRTPDNNARLYKDPRARVCVSSDRGKTWSEPVTIARHAAYMPPKPTASGRLIFPGNITFSWTDDPLGLKDWHWAGLPGLDASFPDDFFNASQRGGQDHAYDEACFYQTDDGVLHMMLRIDEATTLRLGVTESRDNGVTWSKPRLTGYSDSVARAHFGRLPDGRFFGLSCAEPVLKKRTPMVLALSKDGIVFDRHFILGNEPSGKPRAPGFCKHGRYGYPYLHVEGTTGYVIYSVNKEDIAIGRFRLADLR